MIYKRTFRLLCVAFIFALFTHAEAYKRICESQGTCVNCGDNRFSYYKCQGMRDCFPGESCTGDGFCCPVSKKSPPALLETGGSEPLRSTPLHDFNTPCPDGSAWFRPCISDSECISGDEVCAEGKCCSACSHRRRQVLDNLPTTDVVGVHIPQCEPGGKHYRPVQCRAGTEECWCVNAYGRLIGTLQSKSRDNHLICRTMQNALNSEPKPEFDWPENPKPELEWPEEHVFMEPPRTDTDLRREPDIPTSETFENRLTIHFLGDSRDKSRKLDRISLESDDEPTGLKIEADHKKRISSTSSDIPKDTDEDQNRFKSPCDRIKDGLCSGNNSRSKEDNSTSICQCDADCFGTQKCCQSEMGRICLQPVDNGPMKHLATCGSNEEYVKCFDPCQPTCTSNSSTPCPPSECKGGCHCSNGFIRKSTDPHSPCIPVKNCTIDKQDKMLVDVHCKDTLREYKSCGPTCPITCATRLIPLDECNRDCKPGCFCKIPYIAEDDHDPVNSRCVLPAQCPRLTSSHEQSPNGYTHIPIIHPVDPTVSQPSSRGIEYILPGVFNNHYSGMLSGRTPIFQCSDPRKDYQSCGTACPRGCNSRSGGFCSARCVKGCFCRSPYILQDVNNAESGCILSDQCSSYTSNKQTCTDPRKQPTSCFSLVCARSCVNPRAMCLNKDCTRGCSCRDPYVLLNAHDPNSRCILPAECPSPSQCTDPMKEFQTCASSCPLGCNNRVPQTCTPCVSGCFCKTGYVFEDAVDWRSSRCVPITQCPVMSDKLPTSIHLNVAGAVVSSCPAMTNDVNGRMCNFDSDCPSEQRCCRSSRLSLGGSLHQRCTCSDPHAVWNSCGSLCPEYCGQPKVPKCSKTCNPACHCAPGFVKARNDAAAPCVARAQCLLAGARDEGNDLKTTPEPSNPFDEKSLASVQIYGQDGQISGRLRISHYGDKKLRLRGTMFGLPHGDHALLIHQYGDVSENCTHTGPILILDGLHNASAILGNVYGDGSANTEIVKTLDAGDVSSIIGRSLVIHSMSLSEWSARNTDSSPLACGIIGLTSR